VGRILRETEPMPEDATTREAIEAGVVTARHPGDVWHIDLTTVPTGPGFWVPWVPFALPQSLSLPFIPSAGGCKHSMRSPWLETFPRMGSIA